MRAVTMSDVRRLNKWAREFICKEQKLLHTIRQTKVYPDGREESLPDHVMMECVVQVRSSGRFYLAYSYDFEEKRDVLDVVELMEYIFPDGKVYAEVLRDNSDVHRTLCYAEWIREILRSREMEEENFGGVYDFEPSLALEDRFDCRVLAESVEMDLDEDPVLS